jgi:uncharacterized protein
MARGIGVSLPFGMGNNGYFELSYNTLRQVRSNFINLILTRKGERLHQPEFGCCIHEYLFEQLTPETIVGARQCVINAVNQWMPFLQLTKFELRTSSQEIDNNILRLYVGYRLTSAPNIEDEIVLEF